MRDRLIELIKAYPCMSTAEDCFMESISEDITDYLLANGVIVPPCKVGDIVYYFSHRPFNMPLKANTIYEAEVVRIVINRFGTSLIIQIHNEYGCTEVPDISNWGVSVFATREEAEQALKEGADNG